MARRRPNGRRLFCKKMFGVIDKIDKNNTTFYKKD